jgi:hypothetical protein
MSIVYHKHKTEELLSVQVEGENEVLVAGDPERKHMEKCDKQGGILYHPEQMKQAVSYIIMKKRLRT